MTFNRVPLVKICSVRAVEHAVWAREAGANWIGMIFADAPRRIDLDAARAVRRELGDRVAIAESSKEAIEREATAAQQPLLVGVFARQTPDQIGRVLDQVDLDLVQLSGGEHPALAGRIPRPIIRAVHVSDDMTADRVLREAARMPPTMTLLDAKSRQGGGTGQRVDWSVAAAVARQRPIVLAGGLSPGNVAEAIAEVKPWAVDVSSGVERDGVKDREQIRAFIRAAKGGVQA